MTDVNAYLNNGSVTVHGSECAHVYREWRKSGRPVVMSVESVTGVRKQLRSLGIRPESIRFLPCVSLAEGFWSVSPDGSKLRKLSTQRGARIASSRIANRAAREAQ